MSHALPPAPLRTMSEDTYATLAVDRGRPSAIRLLKAELDAQRLALAELRAQQAAGPTWEQVEQALNDADVLRRWGTPRICDCPACSSLANAADARRDEVMDALVEAGIIQPRPVVPASETPQKEQP